MLQVSQNATKGAAPIIVDLGTETKASPPIFHRTTARYPEPSAKLRNQVCFHDVFYEEKKRRAAQIVRSIRRVRAGDNGVPRIFADVVATHAACIRTDRALKRKMESLPENRKLDYPAVRIGYNQRNEPQFSSFPSEIIRHFDRWIKEAKDAGQEGRVAYLKGQKIEKLKDLNGQCEAILEDQRASGLWKLRVESGARRSAFHSLIWEATKCKLDTTSDCTSAAALMGKLSKMAQNDDRFSISPHNIGPISNRIAKRLATVNLRRK
jgi:hypothetical protein